MKQRLISCVGASVLGASLVVFPSIALAAPPASDRSDSTEEPVEASEAATPTPENAQADDQVTSPSAPGLLDRLQIHGFLTQAYADAQFTSGGFQTPSSDEIVLGIPESGTADYRTLAVQFRYKMTPYDNAVVQLSHRRLGISPVAEVDNDIELDWGFYEHKFGEMLYLKVGRIQIPLGIFNEIRDVGTLLPFFRPPFSVYHDGSFVNETIDGVMLGRTFAQATDWALDLDVYYGEFDLVEFPIPGTAADDRKAALATAEDATGLHLWLATPITGLRFGAGARSFHPTGGLFERPGTRTDWWSWNASAEATLERFVVRAEYSNLFPEGNTLPGTGGAPFKVTDDVRSYYLQVGFHLTQKWSLYAQHEGLRSNRRELQGFSQPLSFTVYRDTAVAVNYFVPKNPILPMNTMLKLEHHFIDIGTFGVVGEVPQLSGPPLLEAATRTGEDGRQTILSLAMSF